VESYQKYLPEKHYQLILPPLKEGFSLFCILLHLYFPFAENRHFI